MRLVVKRGLPVYLVVVLAVCLAVYVPVFVYCRACLRMAAITDCRTAQTQTVGVSFAPTRLRWKMSGEVEGQGTVIIPGACSNAVSGWFAVEGGCDYYDTNVSLIFLPQGPTRGSVQASFRFGEWP